MATTSAAFQSLTLPFATKMQQCSRVPVSVLISNLIPKQGNHNRPHKCKMSKKCSDVDPISQHICGKIYNWLTIRFQPVLCTKKLAYVTKIFLSKLLSEIRIIYINSITPFLHWDKNHIANTSSVQYWSIMMIPVWAQCIILCYFQRIQMKKENVTRKDNKYQFFEYLRCICSHKSHFVIGNINFSIHHVVSKSKLKNISYL